MNCIFVNSLVTFWGFLRLGVFLTNLLYIDIKVLNAEMGMIYSGGQRRHCIPQT